MEQIRQSKAHLGFMDLPPEIRNHIYDLVLVRRNSTGYRRPVHIDLFSRANRYPSDSSCFALDMECRAITQTSQLIRNESLPIWLGENSFYVQSPSNKIHLQNLPMLLGFLRAVSDTDRKLIKKIRIYHKPGVEVEVTDLILKAAGVDLGKNVLKMRSFNG